MMGFAVIIGAALASPKDLNFSWLSLVYGFATGFTLTAASMAINDYYDREIDKVNEPRRPIPSGAIKAKEAVAFALLLTIIGFSAAYFTSMSNLLVAILAWIVSVTYTTIGKRSGLPGNFLVSICVAIPFIYGSIAITFDNTVQLNVSIFASLAFLSITGREITKGIVDVQGDREQNVKTLAVRYGERTAAAVAVVFYLSAVALSPTLWILKLVSFWFVPLVIVTDLGLAASSLMLLRDYSRANARKVKKTLLLWFIVGLLAFVAGALG
jgi:geranylgeranylglycerol-phosphate geranylgeranyltransferase